MSIAERLSDLDLELPPPTKAVGVYRPCIVVGTTCYTSGHGPLLPDGNLITGCVGRDADKDAGYAAARQTGLAILATLQHHLGSLDRIQQVQKIFGMVWATPDFTQHPAIINGCSELYRDLFGDEVGMGVRSAVGMSSLPLGMMVEIEAVFQID